MVRRGLFPIIAASAALATVPVAAAGAPRPSVVLAQDTEQDDAARAEGESSGLSGYAIGLGALAVGVAAILIAGGDDDDDGTNPNSP